MSIELAAQAALSTFPNMPIQTPKGTYALPVVMVAIAGAESSWNPQDNGDYGLPDKSCGGYTSWGLWQIHSVHAVYLIQQTHSQNPCDWARWLYDPVNNAKAALAVLGRAPAGLQNWTTWGGPYTGYAAGYGPYLHYLEQAQEAVTTISRAGRTSSGGTTGGTGSKGTTGPVASGGTSGGTTTSKGGTTSQPTTAPVDLQQIGSKVSLPLVLGGAAAVLLLGFGGAMLIRSHAA